MMRTIHTTLLTISLALATGSANAQEACYDFQTGNITFHGMEGILGLTLFAPEEALRKSEATDFGGHAQAVDTGLTGSISWANFGGFPLNALDAGNVIVPGTDPAVVLIETVTSFIEGPPVHIKVINLPEPATFLLAVLGALGCYSNFQRRQAFRNCSRR